MIKMTSTTVVRKSKSDDWFHIILIVGITFILYFGMKDFIYDELIIPQLNIYISAGTEAVLSLLLIMISLLVSNYINGLKKTEDWILGVITPVFFLAAVKLLQYREKFLFAVIVLSAMLVLAMAGVKAIITYIRIKDRQYIESALHLVSVSIAIIGIAAALLLSIASNTCLKTADADKFAAERAGKYSNEYVEYISRFHPDKWEELSYEEKFDAVCFLVKYEEEERGVNTVEQVNIAYETNELPAYYDYSDKTISVNEACLLTADSYSVMDAVLHEFFHSWQYYAVDGNGNIAAAIVSDDEERGADSYTNYDIESLAGDYSEKRCTEYKKVIEKLINSDMY